MRPAGKRELESLYFDYPHFPFEKPAEMTGCGVSHKVVIVGAGPVGMTAAIELARRGIASVILDKKNTLNDGSRAICISRNSLEILQQLGIAARFEEKALGWTHGRCYYRDKMIYRFEMPHSDHERYLPMYNLQQQYIEQFLVERIADFPGLIDMRWQSEVIGINESQEGVELTVDTPVGEYSIETEYLLAADGGRSLIREKCGLRLNGENLPGNYVIADVQMECDFPTERRAFFESEARPDGTILVHKQPDSIWRIDWQLNEWEEPSDALKESNIRKQIQGILNMLGHRGPWQLEWWSIYTANTLCLDDYRRGRIYFIGDSAHIVPIFGVRGLNNGFADAVNIAWKLAYTLLGRANANLLSTYSQERRGATLDVFYNAAKSSRFMTPPSRGYELMRKSALQLSLSQEFTRRLADPRQVTPYIYVDSPLTTFKFEEDDIEGGVAPGEAARNRRISGTNFLLDHIGLGFTALYFIENEVIPDYLSTLFDRLKTIDPDLKVLVIAREEIQIDGVEILLDTNGSVFSEYSAHHDSLYLIRPDRHVAARWAELRPLEAEAALCKSLSII
jgi:3-(3-hydroxy-phenyl)propionate hydroxylase